MVDSFFACAFNLALFPLCAEMTDQVCFYIYRCRWSVMSRIAIVKSGQRHSQVVCKYQTLALCVCMCACVCVGVCVCGRVCGCVCVVVVCVCVCVGWGIRVNMLS